MQNQTLRESIADGAGKGTVAGMCIFILLTLGVIVGDSPLDLQTAILITVPPIIGGMILGAIAGWHCHSHRHDRQAGLPQRPVPPRPGDAAQQPLLS